MCPSFHLPNKKDESIPFAKEMSVPSKADVAKFCQSNDVAKLTEIMQSAVEDSVLLTASKPLLGEIINYAASEGCDGPTAIALCSKMLDAVAKRIASFGEESVRCREILADIHEGDGRRQEAIAVLIGMPMEPGLRSNSDEFKAACWVRIAHLSLEIDNSTQAETYINRAWPIMKNVTDDNLKLQFYTSFAEVSDIKRKFIDAAQRFYKLSQQLEDGMPALRKAIVCIVLADAGPQRARLLTMLNRDERIASLGDLNIILSKVYNSRVLRDKDIALIKPHLLQHHKAVRGDGNTVFDQAIMQHNIQAASRLYYNISFNELGSLLGVTPDAAEKIAAGMISEDRLKATIDQLNEVIWFIADPTAPISQWDQQISNVCNSIAAVADTIAKKDPALAALLEK